MTLKLVTFTATFSYTVSENAAYQRRTTQMGLRAKVFHSVYSRYCKQGCGIGSRVGVVMSRRFLGGVGVGFLRSLKNGVGFFI